MRSSKPTRGVHSQLKLPADEMAVRAPYWELVERRALTTVFRPGDRSSGSFRSYHPGQHITVRKLMHVGADWINLPPMFAPEARVAARIVTQIHLPIEVLKPEHFEGSSPDVIDLQSLLYHLGVIYNLPLSEITSVTRTTFEYI